MRIKDREFELFIGKDELAGIVARLGREVSEGGVVGNGALMVCPVLTGAYMFAADLVRRIEVESEVHFVRYTSYVGMQSSGEVRCELPFKDIEGRDVLIVEDVIDSGLSMGRMLAEVRALRPARVRVCALLMKPGAFKGDYRVDFVGREIGDEFIVGYGMDYDEAGRTLDAVYRVS